MLVEYAVITGIMFGLFFALVALGLNLVFAVLKVINLAHGDFIMLGAYAAYFAYSQANLNPLIAIVAMIIPFAALGYALYYLLIPRTMKAADSEMMSLIMFFGLSQVIEAAGFLAFGSSVKSLPNDVFGASSVHILGQAYPTGYVVSAAVCIPALAIVFYLLYRTRLGYATRAVVADPEEAEVAGVSVSRVKLGAFSGGIVLAGISGALSIFMLSGTSPDVGINVTVTAFAVVVLGSLGNPLGSVVAGPIYGLVLSFAEVYAPSWSGLVPYVLLVVVLLARPAGLLGRSLRTV